MERGQGHALPDGVYDVVVDEDGIGEALSAVDDPVADGADLLDVLHDAVFPIGQCVHHVADGNPVVGDAGPDRDLADAEGVVPKAGTVRADAFHAPPGDELFRLHVEKLVFQ